MKRYLFFSLLFIILTSFAFSDSLLDSQESKRSLFQFDFLSSEVESNFTISEDGEIEAMGLESSAYTALVIPENINGIEIVGIKDNVFLGLPNLETVFIPDSIKSIGNRAFSSCPKLKSVRMPEKLNYLGVEVFSQDKNLEDINIPQNLRTIPEGTFKSCYSLKEIEIPTSVTRISKEAFAHCHSLRSVALTNVRYVEEKAFNHCQNLSSLTISGSLIAVGLDAFLDCPLKTIYYPGKKEDYQARQSSFFRVFGVNVVAQK